MGFRFADQYSLLHASVGVVMYFWNFSFITSIVLHTIFEILENTKGGVKFIQNNLAFFWPGGKREPDAIINELGDTVFFGGGWLIAAWLDTLGKQQGWYYPAK